MVVGSLLSCEKQFTRDLETDTWKSPLAHDTEGRVVTTCTALGVAFVFCWSCVFKN